MKKIILELSDRERDDSYSRLKAKFADRFMGFSTVRGIDVADNFTANEEKQLKDIIAKRDTLDSKEQSKLRNLMWTQLENEITARQNEINAVTNLAQAKTAMLNLLADEAKAWRIVLWLMKREMQELE